MIKKDKIIARFLTTPKDFTFDELVKLFTILGFQTGNKGKTSGSRIEFINKDLDLKYFAHKPHPNNSIKTYVIKQIKEFLTQNKLL